LIEKIAESFYMITLPMPFRLKHVHVFALVHDGSVSLFDTGMNTPETFATLEESLKSIGKDIRNIERIFITHFHTDHCGIAGRIQEISGALVAMSEVDAQRIYNDQKRGFDFDQVRIFYREQGLREKFIDGLLELLSSFRKATIPFKVDTSLEDHGSHKVGDREFEVISVPGHTSGQVCFFFRREGILLSGDHILPEITPNLSPDPYNPGFRPLKNFLDSLGQVEDLPVIKVYPAHGDPFSNLKARVEEIREHHRERKNLVFESVKGGPKTTFQVSLDIFGRDLPEFDQFLAVNETYAHLIELKEEGLIKQKKLGDLVIHSVV
jgi:glyoxylase-like metal-dependent hydrolase (beta-lactamase superfamily II)